MLYSLFCRYDAEDCSAAVELKPTKPPPAITNFFKEEPRRLSPPAAAAAAGHGGGGETPGAGRRHTESGEPEGDQTRGNATAPAATLAALTIFPCSPATTGAKHEHSSKGGGGGGDVASGTRAQLAAMPSPRAFSPKSPSAAAAASAYVIGKRPRTTAAGSPSPRKKSPGSKAGAAAAAAARKDKKQSKLTAFFHK